MLRSSFMNDPFFGGADNHMREIDDVFDTTFGQRQRRNRNKALPEGRHSQQLAHRDMFRDPFAHFDSMFSNMRSMMADMHRSFDGSQPSTGDGRVYQHSSFMSYSNTGQGAPKVYQASTSTHQGPGGIRETRKTLRDSETGIDKMSVGRHIKDRGHVIERRRNNKTGDMDEEKEYINLDEEDVPCFENEYREKWQSPPTKGVDQRRRADRSKHAAPVLNKYYAPLPEPEGRRHRRSSHRKE